MAILSRTAKRIDERRGCEKHSERVKGLALNSRRAAPTSQPYPLQHRVSEALLWTRETLLT